MNNLSFLSPLEDVIRASDSDLLDGIGNLSPNTVTEYVFYLRKEVSKLRNEKAAAEEMINRLQSPVQPLQINLASSKRNEQRNEPRNEPRNGPRNEPRNLRQLDFSQLVPDSVWTWADNGIDPSGIIKFCSDGLIQWNNQEKQGCWKFIYNGTSLEAKFNGECHKLMYVACELKAIARNRTGTVAMWIQGDRGDFPFGKDLCSSKVTLARSLPKSTKAFVVANIDGSADCAECNLSADAMLHYIQIKPGMVAFRSRFRTYLTVQPSGKLEWIRAKTPNIKEFFEVNKVREEDSKITLYSYNHRRNVAVKPDGTIMLDKFDKDDCLYFEVKAWGN